jgi:hypothetical protein
MNMKNAQPFVLVFASIFIGCGAIPETTPGYEDLVFLDAETLAEGGIGEAHSQLLPRIRAHAPAAGPIEERLDSEAGRYVVSNGDRDYVIYAPDLPEELGESWGRATHAFFEIVNDQLASSEVRFYAINGGNDLAGRFLTPAEAEALRASTEAKFEWPYVPTLEPPWCGMYH